MKAKPFVKWAGGKRRIAKHVLDRLPAEIDTYYEPFVGGGAVFFALATEEPRRFKKAVLGDLNPDLINAYRVVRDNPHDMISILRKMTYGREEFLAERDLDPRDLSNDRAAARFVYLNKCCFSGLYRTNKEGKFMTAFGKLPKAPNFCNEPQILAASAVLQGVSLICAGYEETTATADAKDGIFFDPPYRSSPEKKSFDMYTKERFPDPEQVKLSKYYDECVTANVSVILSNSPAAAALYEGHNISYVDSRKCVAAYVAGFDKDFKEILVTPHY